jgi:enterochelin esterase-like enzyme
MRNKIDYLKIVQLSIISLILIIFVSCKQNTQREGYISEAKIIDFHAFPSKFIDSVNVDVWLPKGYSTDKKYAVLYMQDGQNLFDSLRNTYNNAEWHVDETLTDLMRKDEIRPTIVVGIWNKGSRRFGQYFPQKAYEALPEYILDTLANFEKQISWAIRPVFSDDYLKFVVEELKPFIDNKFPTLPDKSNTFVAGSSMGGLISMYSIFEYPEIFGGAACLSTHWIGIMNDKNPEFTEAFVNYIAENLPSPNNHKLYFDYGTKGLDAMYEKPQLKVDSVLKSMGYDSTNWVTLKFQGHDHNESSWSKRLDTPFKFLLNE